MSREDVPEGSNKQKNPSPEETKTPEPALTPWQIANQEYKKNHPELNNDVEELSSETDESAVGSEQSDNDAPQQLPLPEEDSGSSSAEEEMIAKLPFNGSFLERLPNIRHERNRRMYRRLLFLVLLFALPSLVLLYYISPLSKLADVSVTGNRAVAAEKIKKDLNFAVGGNLWPQFFQREEYIKTLKKKELQIENASISFKGANHFVVKVKEYEEVAYVEKGGKYSPVIKNGKIVPIELKKAEGGLPILEGFSDSERILAVLTQYKQLSEAIRQGISQIKYAPTKENKELLQIFMNDGNQALVTLDEMSKKMRYYPQVVKQMNEKEMKGIVDMEAGIFTRPYPEKPAKDDSEKNTTEKSSPVKND